MKRLLKTIFWKGFKLLPKSMRGKFLRLVYSVELGQEDLEFKLAETQEEIFEALTLLQRSYQELSMTSDSSNIRISKFNFMPSTYIFIAKYKNEIIGTISVVQDSNLGLPTDDFNNINFFRQKGSIGEISGFAIKKQWRSRSTGVSIPLSLMALDHYLNTLKLDYLFITVRDSALDFYESICNFKLYGEKRNYQRVNGLSSVSLYIDRSKYLTQIKGLYQNENKLSKNFYYQLTQFPWKRKNNFIGKKLMTQKVFFESDFFVNLACKTNLLQDLKDEEIQTIRNSLNLKILSKKDIYFYRKSYRFSVQMHGHYNSEVNNNIFKLHDASLEGLCFYGDINLIKDNELVIMNDSEEIHLKGKIAWYKDKKIGFEITEQNSKWQNLIHSFQSSILEQSQNSHLIDAA